MSSSRPRPAQAAWAQRAPLYVQFDPCTVKGALYRPDSGDAPTIGVLLIHRVNNYLGHLAGPELARRGFLVLAMNSRFDNTRRQSCGSTSAST